MLFVRLHSDAQQTSRGKVDQHPKSFGCPNRPIPTIHRSIHQPAIRTARPATAQDNRKTRRIDITHPLGPISKLNFLGNRCKRRAMRLYGNISTRVFHQRNHFGCARPPGRCYDTALNEAENPVILRIQALGSYLKYLGGVS